MKAVSPQSLDAAVAALAADPDLVPMAGCADLMVGTPAGGITPLNVEQQAF